jgi:hypothetical protein
MKSRWINRYFTLLFVLGVLTACQNPVETPESHPEEKTPANIKVSTSTPIASGGEISFPGVKVRETGDITITIQNSGETSLNLTGTPSIKLEGDVTLFEVIGQPGKTTLAQNEQTTFTLRFKPVNTAKASVTVSIQNSSKNAPGFKFVVSGQGTVTASASIKVSASYEAPDGSPISTEIGMEGRITNAFTNVYVYESGDMVITIENLGEPVLRLTGTPPEIIKLNSTVFKIVNQPDKVELGRGEKTTFTLRFESSHANKATVDVQIPNTSGNAPDFIFTVEGQAKKKTSDIKLFNGDTEIAQEETVSLGDTILSQSKTVSLSIMNTGLIPLQLTGDPLINITGDDAAKFTVVTKPVKDIAVNESTSFQIKFEPTGEGEVGAVVTIKNNANTDFRFFINGNGVISKSNIGIYYAGQEKAQNSLVDIGNIGINVPQDIEITVKNSGNKILTLMPDDITITGADRDAFSLKTKPSSAIPIDGESKFIIRCTPLRTGEHNAIITIPNDDTSRNTAVFFIKANGVVPYSVIELSASDTIIGNNTGSFDFGTVETGASSTQVFLLKNTGIINLELTGNPVVNSSDTSLFSITANPSKIQLLPNETAQFTVRYAPQTEGTRTAEITIAGNIETGYFKFTTRGTGYTKKPEIVVKQGANTMSNMDVFNFGSATTIEQKTVDFTITNTGDTNLTLSNSPAVYLSSNDSGAFSIERQPSVSIAPNNTSSFTVKFSPSNVADNISAYVVIKSNSKNNADFSFQVKGSAYQAIPVTPSILRATGDIHTVTQNVGAGSKKTYYPITVSWTESPGAEEYRIYYSTTATGFTARNYTSVTDATSATILGRSTTQYKYIKISAKNKAGESEQTAVKTISSWTNSSDSYGSGGSTR